MNNVFDIDKFNIIEDEENYYFFRALNMADNKDIEEGTILDEEGNFTKIRTDRERYQENPENPAPKYNKDDEINLEQVYDHIKMHYRKDTNCISLSSNANVSVAYGRGFYKDKYVMIKVPKKEFGEKVINAGQYMLEEIKKAVNEYISSINADNELMETLTEVDNSRTEEEIREKIALRYKAKEKLDREKAGVRKGITFRTPMARISNYQALNGEQSLEKNKIIAKLTLLERVGGMKPIIPHTSTNNLLIQTIGNAFSSLELIHYGEIEKEDIIDLPKEIVDIFALIQQIDGQDEKIVKDLKQEVVNFVINGKDSELLANISSLDEYTVKNNISIEEMYELTNGRVEYGMANSIVKSMFYLSKAQANARVLANVLRNITNNNEKYRDIIEYILNNGFRIEPEIITRRSNRGYKISESISLDIKNEEVELIDKITELSIDEQKEIIENGGLSNIRDIMSSTFSTLQRNEVIDKEEYYSEAIFSLYDWEKIGIDEFTIEEKNNLINRIQNEYCVELYKKLYELGIDQRDIPTILLNIITRNKDFDITENDTSDTIKGKRLEQYDRIINNDIEALKEDLSIERIERFLGYYDVKGTGIKLRPYQQRAVERTQEIFESERFASIILPTGAGKSFVALSQLMEHRNEEILYLAPQNEILEQMKDYIIKYIHGPVNTLGRSKDEIISDVFPNLRFSTYPGLLAKNGEETINKKYEFIILDELHRTGAKEWKGRLDTLIDNQNESTKVLGMTATPRRDVDGIDMANEMAERLGYTNSDAVKGKHIAMNMSLINAIRMGLVVNPKLVSCEYSLKTNGSLESLKEKIEQLQDSDEKNEMLKKHETLRRKVEKAEGIQKVLQDNVKKGGKYIVFLPVFEQIEDEDGNAIERKKGKEKVKDYEEKLAEYFRNSGISPKFHSMLGEYGDDENERRLEKFQNSNTSDTEFMLVMNKANEGLHIDNLDGIIWLRPLDENSKILYLQQLGRVIFSEDPDNPIKDEDRPTVIDLVNNTSTVNWNKEVTQQDDIEMLNIIVEWTQNHNGTLPNINSSDKEEIGYATVLKDIQKKYQQFIDNEFGDVNEKQIEEIKEIIELGSIINLWQIELGDRIQKNGEKHNRSNNNSMSEDFFEMTGLLKDFVDLRNEIEDSLDKSAVAKLIKLLEKLEGTGVDVSKLPRSNQGEKTLLKNIKAQDKDGNEVDISEIVQKMGKQGEIYNIGGQVSIALQAAKGKGTCTITEEEIDKLIGFRLITREEIEKVKSGIKEESAVAKLIKLLEKLEGTGVDVSKLPRSNRGEKTLLKNIKAQDKDGNEVDISEIVQEMGEQGAIYNIGSKINNSLNATKGKSTYIITEEEIDKLIGFGLITREEIEKAKSGIKESAVSQLLILLEKLEETGVDVRQFPKSNKLLKDIKAQDKDGNEVDISRIIQEWGSTYNIGNKIANAIERSKRKRTRFNNRGRNK